MGCCNGKNQAQNVRLNKKPQKDVEESFPSALSTQRVKQENQENEVPEEKQAVRIKSNNGSEASVINSPVPLKQLSIDRPRMQFNYSESEPDMPEIPSRVSSRKNPSNPDSIQDTIQRYNTIGKLKLNKNSNLPPVYPKASHAQIAEELSSFMSQNDIQDLSQVDQSQKVPVQLVDDLLEDLDF